MVPPISSAQRCVSAPFSSLSIFDLISVAFTEHQCRWTVQQDRENRGFEPTHLLQQRHWHIRQTFLEISQLSHASRRQHHRSRYCLVRIIGFWLSYTLADKLWCRNFEKIIIGAYRWLSDNYQENDRIFLFGESKLGPSISYYLHRSNILGFSRGAYQVRALAGMIHRVRYSWLIHRLHYMTSALGRANPQGKWRTNSFVSTSYKIPERVLISIYSAYALYATHTEKLATRFKSTFSRENVKVHFIGVW